MGSSLKDLREQRGFSRKELAERVGVSALTIRSWELGTREPNLINLQKLSEALGISSDEVLGSILRNQN